MSDKNPKNRAENKNEEKPAKVMVTPLDQKYGWVVVISSFICNAIADGMQFTFANFLGPISVTLHNTVAEVSLIGSLLSGFYNFSGPVGSALGNKFGFRMVAILGSLISSLGLGISYFATNKEYLYCTYGVLGGSGFGMIYMSSVIMTSLYFEKYRALAVSISVCGTGVGTFLFSPMGNWLVVTQGWRLALVIEAGIVFLCVFCAYFFKPIEFISIVEGTPAGSNESIVPSGSVFYPPENMFINEAFPTVKEALLGPDNESYERRMSVMPRQSIAPQPRSFSVSAQPRSFSISTQRRSRSIYEPEAVSLAPPHTPTSSEGSLVEGITAYKCYKCKRCIRVCCFNFWHCRCKRKTLSIGDRPMYRDDVFYAGSLSQLPEYSGKKRVHYHLSVIRMPAPQEAYEHLTRKCWGCHHAFIRTCVTMTGARLLTSTVFVFLCISSFLYTMGLFIPYVFIRELAIQNGMPDSKSVWLVAALGISNTAGRLTSGIIKSIIKVNAALCALVGLIISGVFAFVFLLTISEISLFGYACIFGFFTAPFISLRPVIIVEFLGLEKLTNAFGLVLLSQGVACIIGPPIAGIVLQKTGKAEYVIYMTGGLMLMSACALLTSTVIFLRRQKNDL